MMLNVVLPTKLFKIQLKKSLYELVYQYEGFENMICYVFVVVISAEK